VLEGVPNRVGVADHFFIFDEVEQDKIMQIIYKNNYK